MLLNKAWFKVNGGNKSGYVLKPQFMYDIHHQFDPLAQCMDQPIMLLEVEVISGQQIPKPLHQDAKEIVDPSIEIKIHGIEKDNTETKVTSVIQNNGYNPVWNEKFRFEIRMPEMAVLSFQVFDNEVNRQTLVCQYAIPVVLIRYGIRRLPMLDLNLNRMEFTCLLCKFTIEPLTQEI